MRIFIALLLGSALLSLWSASSESATLPTPPQVFIDTTYSRPSGNTIVVNAGGNFQNALNNAQPGDTIALQAGATFTGPFTLPNKTGSGWIYIQSSAYASLPPPGTRVSSADAANMPKIVGTSSGVNAITTAAGAHHFRFVGIEIRPAAGQFVYSLVAMGDSVGSLANLPHDITFDRCYVHGDPAVGGRRGIAMNGNNIAVVDSHFSDFKENSADTQTLMAWNGAGPFKIVNNYLEAAGENIMFGGGDPRIANLVPSDIEIRRNHFFKPLSWVSLNWTVKNLIELKNARRILIEANVFENNWADAQSGMAINMSPSNQDGGAPWSTVEDVAFRLNKLINVGQGIQLSGTDPDNSSQTAARVLIEHNLILVTNIRNESHRIFQITSPASGPNHVTIRHNTGLIFASGGATGHSEILFGKADNFDFRDNLLSMGNVGFGGTGTGEGTATLNAMYTNYTFTRNAIIGSSGTYPSGNFFPANNAAVGFVNFAGGNYRLSASSTFKNAGTDGKDLGADIDAIEAAIAGTGTGLPPPRNLRLL